MLRATFLTALIGLALAMSAPAFAQSPATGAAHVNAKHKVVLQVSDKDPQKWHLALNNAGNIQKDIGRDKVDIELVANGPGVDMLKMDPIVAQRVHDALAANIKVVACENTMRGHHLSKEDILPEVGYVSSGVVELMEKQEQGYAYLRP